MIEHFELLKKLYGDEMKQLAEIQSKLHVPKDNVNTFGKYKYRTCGDILEAVKPLLNGCTITLSDELVMVGERYYIKATATLLSPDGASTAVTAFARESFDKKGMDDSQITGAASTYARKYALNGLLAIDDTEDADSMDNTRPPQDQKAGVWDNLSGEVTLWIKEVAAEVEASYKSDNIAACLEHFELAKFELEQENAFWSLLDSKVRSTIKAAWEINKATDMDTLKKAWEASPKHAQPLLIPIKDSKKFTLQLGD